MPHLDACSISSDVSTHARGRKLKKEDFEPDLDTLRVRRAALEEQLKKGGADARSLATSPRPPNTNKPTGKFLDLTQLLWFGAQKYEDAVDALGYLILGLVGEGISPQEIHYVG